MNPVKRGARLAICIAGAAGIALLALQLALLWAVSDGWSGIRASLPLLGAGALLSALACAALFYTRRFRNSKKDGKLYSVITVLLAIMAVIYGGMGLLGLLTYFGIV